MFSLLSLIFAEDYIKFSLKQIEEKMQEAFDLKFGQNSVKCMVTKEQEIPNFYISSSFEINSDKFFDVMICGANLVGEITESKGWKSGKLYLMSKDEEKAYWLHTEDCRNARLLRTRGEKLSELTFKIHKWK